MLKHFPLSSVCLSPAQTCFRYPLDLLSAAVLWEALIQHPSPLYRVLVDHLHPCPCTKGSPYCRCLSQAMNRPGVVTLKTAVSLRYRKARLLQAPCRVTMLPLTTSSLAYRSSQSLHPRPRCQLGLAQNPVLGSFPGSGGI